MSGKLPTLISAKTHFAVNTLTRYLFVTIRRCYPIWLGPATSETFGKLQA